MNTLDHVYNPGRRRYTEDKNTTLSEPARPVTVLLSCLRPSCQERCYRMNTRLKTLSLTTVLLFGASVALATAIDGDIAIPEGSAAYANAEGEAIRTGTGDCLRLGGFDEENQVNACEGIDDSEAEAEPEAAPEAAPVPPKEPVAREPTVSIATLGAEALFDTSSADLVAASEQALTDLLTELDEYPEISRIVVIGHTDSRGTEDYNQALSERRAEAVQAYLQAAYPDVDITSRGEGEDRPVATNSTAEGRQLNRRVDIEVTAKSISDA